MGSTEQDELASYFDRSVTSVQGYINRFESEYARPALKASKTHFDQFPVSSLFLLSFVALSLLPILIFLGVVLFSVGGLVSIAVGLVLGISIGLVLVLGSILLLTLFINICIALFITGLLLMVHLLARLFKLVSRYGLGGVNVWLAETSNRATQSWNGLLGFLHNGPSGSDSPKSTMMVDDQSSDYQTVEKEAKET
ncbi:hypothetical protein AAF712_005423 [Marasmius tenuissimus]|uniref:Promethin n=1 Tax=Marasmius tenuissimus TaxID=585030 RepID=A0ABR3A0Q0_9AGAR